MKLTQEQKKRYYQTLRKNWEEAKKYADVDAISAIIAHHGINISVISYAYVQMQMAVMGYDGIPYIDMKTYAGWKENGFQVIKGEKSKVDGITWIPIDKKVKDDNEGEDVIDSWKMPKAYRLFHRSQVKAI